MTVRTRWSLLAFAAYGITVAGIGAWFVANNSRTHSQRMSASDSSEAVPDTQGFVGAQACAACHESRFDGFASTTHHLTSRAAQSDAILGSFEPEKNVLQTRVEPLWIEMSRDASGAYQTAVAIVRGQTTDLWKARFDVVTGSGKLGQTYLYWRDDELFQLPASYLTSSQSWINSPGFKDGLIRYDRPTLPRCLECHSTYIKARAKDSNRYDRSTVIWGISCERCHGPGREHIDFHKDHPETETGRHIIHPRHISRDRKLDLCAQCHSGAGKLIQSPFTYRPGESLAEFLDIGHSDDEKSFSVHSNNQLPRLRQSKCFRESDSLSCTDCHDPHRMERGQLNVFSGRCQKCHDAKECRTAARHGATALSNCIDCHMPRRNDEGMPFSTRELDRMTPVWMREHRIGVYTEDTQKVLSEWGRVSP